LSDLTFTEDGNLNLTPEGLINWGKRSLLYNILVNFKQQQARCHFDFEDSKMREWFLFRGFFKI